MKIELFILKESINLPYPIEDFISANKGDYIFAIYDKCFFKKGKGLITSDATEINISLEFLRLNTKIFERIN